MNDIAVYGIQGSVDNLMALIGKVREKSPDVEIYVESVTDIRVYNAWQEDTGAYVEQNILADTLIREILAGRMFYVGGQYCDRRAY